MLGFAAPALGLRLASSDAGNDPAEPDHASGLRPARQGFRPGRQRAAAASGGAPAGRTTPRRLKQLTAAVRRDAGIASVAPPRLNADGDRGGGRRLPDDLAAERADLEPGRAAARQRDPAGRARHRRAGVRRRSDGVAGRLLARSVEQAAAVHRGRHRACGAAAAARVPVARDSGAGRPDEPALDRRRRSVSSRPCSSAAGWAGCSASRPGRSTRSSPCSRSRSCSACPWTTRCS